MDAFKEGPSRAVASPRWAACLASCLVLETSAQSPPTAVLPPLAEKYCVACHLPPPPDALPRRHWTQVFGFMSVSIREKGLPFELPEYQSLLRDYLALAPERLDSVPDDLSPPGLAFEVRPVGRPCLSSRPVVAHLEAADLDGDGRPELLVCDAVANEVRLLRPGDGEWTEETLFQIEAPSRTAVVDYDGDGLPDIAVASLGVLRPTDDPVGSVWLLRNLGEAGFQAEPLLVNCPRVADVKAADLNGDGRPDLLVTQFGWRSSGGLLWLEQRSPTQFVAHGVAMLHGPLQSEVLDFDGDGRLDFVTLFAQEHESLVLFRNDGKGGFESNVLARAPHPAFGSSGFSVVDMDGDGDLDFLWTHGDMMDEIPLPKPYHGLRWLENQGGELVSRELLRMPGCYRALARDIDGDGDLDIVVSSIYPQWDEHDFPSLVWLENDGRRNFTPRRLLDSPANLASLAVDDFDGDGLPDLILGGMHVPGPLGRVGRLTGVFGLRPQPSGEGEP